MSITTDQCQAVLVAEQSMREALRITGRAVVVHTGRVVLVERAQALGQREDLFSLVIEGWPGGS
jgi:ABC-type branched-subunit amino acid transport system ATPase component